MKKIVVIGPESTGKSMLCEKLAKHYDTIWVKEYAREYLLKNGTDYTFENLLDVAKGQIISEEEGINAVNGNSIHAPFTIHHSPIFIDTNMYVMKVWCEFVFDNCHNWILDQIVKRKYDLYLLTNIDAPWIKDELREYPDLMTRKKLYHHYKDIMVNQHESWTDIRGDYDERLQTAINAVDNLLLEERSYKS